LMFSKGVWSYICKQTNLYSKQRIKIKPYPERKK
jgi:hypothetical protein